MLGAIQRVSFEIWVESLGNATTTLMGKALFLHLAKNDFSPSLDIDPTKFEAADFDGVSIPAITAGARATAYDEATGELLVIVPPAANGNHWVTGSDANLPQVIYGVVLNDSSVSINGSFSACGRLDTPIQLTAELQSIDIPLLRLRINPAAVDGL